MFQRPVQAGTPSIVAGFEAGHFMEKTSFLPSYDTSVPVPRKQYVRAVQVAQGFDIADNEIVRRCEPGDLVVTADIPLAAEVIAKGATALNPRGELYTKENVKARLNMRDFMDTMRSSGIHTGGPPALNQRDRQAFANALDRFIARVGRS